MAVLIPRKRYLKDCLKVVDKLAGPLHYIFKEGLVMKEFAVKHPFITLLAPNLVSILRTGKEPESED